MFGSSTLLSTPCSLITLYSGCLLTFPPPLQMQSQVGLGNVQDFTRRSSLYYIVKLFVHARETWSEQNWHFTSSHHISSNGMFQPYTSPTDLCAFAWLCLLLDSVYSSIAGKLMSFQNGALSNFGLLSRCLKKRIRWSSVGICKSFTETLFFSFGEAVLVPFDNYIYDG